MAGRVWMLGGLVALAALGCGEAEEEDPVFAAQTALTILNLERETEPGVSVGLDLDGQVSRRGDPRGCEKRDFTDPDGNEGVDNELARALALVDLVGENAAENLANLSINEGDLLVYFRLERFEDGTARLIVQRGEDTPLLGTDGLLLEDQSLALHSEPQLGEISGLTQNADGIWYTPPFQLRLPVPVFAEVYDFTLEEAFLQFRYDEATGRMTEGLIAGGLSMDDLMTGLETAAKRVPEVLEFRDSIRGFADLPHGSEECGAMSAAVTFEATPVFLY